jgi:hypothetical protein
MRLLYRPASLCSLTGQYDKPMAESPTAPHTKRQATQHDCLPSLLYERWGIEIVYGEKKIFCTGQNRTAKVEQNLLFTSTTIPTNQPGKDLFIGIL